MTGSVRRRGKTWTCYWWVTDPQGRRAQRSKGGFPTKKAAQSHLSATLAAIGDGQYTEVTDPKITLSGYLAEHWLPVIRVSARRASTINSYVMTVNKWIIPYVGAVRLTALTPGHVERLLETLRTAGGRDGHGLGPRGVQYTYTVLRQALEHGVQRGYLPRNPAALVERPRAVPREMTCWTAAEAAAFLQAAADDRLHAAWVLFLARGPRRGELAGLRWQDVDLDAGWARIVHTRISVAGRAVESSPKTAAGRRTMHLDPGLVTVLRQHRARQLQERLTCGPAWRDAGYVFTTEDGSPVHPEHLSHRFDRLCTRAQVRRIRLHDARHTAATLMLADGTPVKVAAEMLGHANPAITQAIYQHVLPGMTQDAGSRLSNLLGLNDTHVG